MSEFLINDLGTKIWYDYKYINRDTYVNNWYYATVNGENFYFRPHRDNGPAVIYPFDGSEIYCSHGAYHREDGPALIYRLSQCNYWYLNGVKHQFIDWCKILNKSEEEINFLKLKWNII